MMVDSLARRLSAGLLDRGYADEIVPTSDRFIKEFLLWQRHNDTHPRVRSTGLSEPSRPIFFYS